jgi:hypothetical protein
VAASFVLRRPTAVVAAVYDLRGRLVAELMRGDLPAGEHELYWDGRAEGRVAEAGVYLLRVSGEQFVLTSKLLLLK